MLYVERDEQMGATYYRLRFSLRNVGPSHQSWYDWAYTIGWSLRHAKQKIDDILWGFADGWMKR